MPNQTDTNRNRNPGKDFPPQKAGDHGQPAQQEQQERSGGTRQGTQQQHQAANAEKRQPDQQSQQRKAGSEQQQQGNQRHKESDGKGKIATSKIPDGKSDHSRL